jgi:hypothetical protein
VLPGQNQGVGHTIKRHGQASTGYAEHLLVVFQLILVFIECRHVCCFLYRELARIWSSGNAWARQPAWWTVAFEAQAACSKLYRMTRAEHNLLKPVAKNYGVREQVTPRGLRPVPQDT